MTPLRDDELADLLRDTFAAHEDLVDPTYVLLPPPHRPNRSRAVLAGVAAAVLLVAGAGVTVAVRTGSAGSNGPADRRSSPTQSPVVASDASNRALTRAVADQLLSSVPLLPGGTEVGPLPVPALTGHTSTIGESTNTVTRTRWWTGGGDVDSAVAYYLQHPPHGMTASLGMSTADGPGRTARGVQYADRKPHPAYTTRFLLLQIAPHGNGVAVRGDTFVNWRPVRTGSSTVSDVSAVVAKVVRSPDLGTPGHVVRRGTLSDPAGITRLLQEVNGWYGVAPVALPRCGLPREPINSYVLDFHTGYGPVVMRATDYCGGTVQLFRRGQTVAPALDATDQLARLVRRLTR